MYSDAVIQTCVQHSLHVLVEPRLDSLADRLAGVVASAQNELRELERCVERAETRLDGRLAHVESKVAVLGDVASRAEQRERDLNTRIAGLAEGMLRRSMEDAVTPSGAPDTNAHQLNCRASALDANHLVDLERRLREATEESCRKVTRHARKLEDRVDGVEEQARNVSRLGHRLQQLFEEKQPVRSSSSSEIANCTQRISQLEEDIRTLTARTAQPQCDGGSRSQLLALEQRMECQRLEIEAALVRLSDRCQEVQTQAHEQKGKQEEMRDETRVAAERAQSAASRVDDLNLRLGALKVKTDGLEGRLAIVGERGEGARQQLDTQMQSDLDRCRRSLGELEPRIEVLERQQARLPEVVEDAVEDAMVGRYATGGRLAARRSSSGGGNAGGSSSSANHKGSGREGREASGGGSGGGGEGTSSRDKERRRHKHGGSGGDKGGVLHGTPSRAPGGVLGSAFGDPVGDGYLENWARP